jgi:hypothetical protein
MDPHPIQTRSPNISSISSPNAAGANQKDFSHASGPGVAAGPEAKARSGSLLARWLNAHARLQKIANGLGLPSSGHLVRKHDSSHDALNIVPSLLENPELIDTLPKKQVRAVAQALAGTENDASIAMKEECMQKLSIRLLHADPDSFDLVIDAYLRRDTHQHTEQLGKLIGFLFTRHDVTANPALESLEYVLQQRVTMCNRGPALQGTGDPRPARELKALVNALATALSGHGVAYWAPEIRQRAIDMLATHGAFGRTFDEVATEFFPKLIERSKNSVTSDAVLCAGMAYLHEHATQDQGTGETGASNLDIARHANGLLGKWLQRAQHGRPEITEDLKSAVRDWTDIIRKLEREASQFPRSPHRPLLPPIAHELMEAKILLGALTEFEIGDRTREFPRLVSNQSPWRPIDLVYNKASWDLCWGIVLKEIDQSFRSNDAGIRLCPLIRDPSGRLEQTLTQRGQRITTQLRELLTTPAFASCFHLDFPDKLQQLANIIANRPAHENAEGVEQQQQAVLRWCFPENPEMMPPAIRELVLLKIRELVLLNSFRSDAMSSDGRYQILHEVVHSLDTLSDPFLEHMYEAAKQNGLLPKDIVAAAELINEDIPRMGFTMYRNAEPIIQEARRKNRRDVRVIGFAQFVERLAKEHRLPVDQFKRAALQQLDDPESRPLLLDILPNNTKAAFDAIRTFAPQANLIDMLQSMDLHRLGTRNLTRSSLLPYLNDLNIPRQGATFTDIAGTPRPEQSHDILDTFEKAGMLPKRAHYYMVALHRFADEDPRVTPANFLWSLDISKFDAKAAVTKNDVVAYLQSIDPVTYRDTPELRSKLEVGWTEL